jgi:hypothetical protein
VLDFHEKVTTPFGSAQADLRYAGPP